MNRFGAGNLATVRYVDREIGIADETAALCAEVGRAFLEERTLVAGVLGRFAWNS